LGPAIEFCACAAVGQKATIRRVNIANVTIIVLLTL
jgi:hypothetical protein